MGFETHSGKYALLANTTAAYNVEFITPPGAVKAAPAKLSNQAATIGQVTTIAEQAFLSATLSGTVTNPAGTAVIEGVDVEVYNNDWTIAQGARTGQNGVWKVYVPNTSSNQCYTIEARPRDYHSQKLGIKRRGQSMFDSQ